MPSQRLKPPSNPERNRELLWAIITLIVMTFALWSTPGCSLLDKHGGPEPEWAPSLYRVKIVEGRCTFYNPAMKHTLDCDEPLIQDYVLIHSSFLPQLVQKFNQCEVWK